VPKACEESDALPAQVPPPLVENGLAKELPQTTVDDVTATGDSVSDTVAAEAPCQEPLRCGEHVIIANPSGDAASVDEIPKASKDIEIMPASSVVDTELAAAPAVGDVTAERDDSASGTMTVETCEGDDVSPALASDVIEVAATAAPGGHVDDVITAVDEEPTLAENSLTIDVPATIVDHVTATAEQSDSALGTVTNEVPNACGGSDALTAQALESVEVPPLKVPEASVGDVIATAEEHLGSVSVADESTAFKESDVSPAIPQGKIADEMAPIADNCALSSETDKPVVLASSNRTDEAATDADHCDAPPVDMRARAINNDMLRQLT
jgi:hypothetical protein